MYESNANRETPWGYSDFRRVLAPGIIEYCTPSHGGIWLSDHRQQQLLNKGLTIKNFLKSEEWWEEDCDWAIPFVIFAEDIKKHGSYDSEHFEFALKAAKESNKYWHPELTALH